MRILVTRPEPDAAHQAEALTLRGHTPVLAPLLRVESLPGAIVDPAGVQALVVTSRNAIRTLSGRPDLPSLLRLSVFAVGEATAEDAAKLGFARVIVGPGNAAGLVEQIVRIADPSAGALLHLAGETLAFNLEEPLAEQGFPLRQAVLYRTVPARELPPEALALLQAGKLDAIVLMSPRTARVLVDLVQRHDAGAKAAALNCYCLSAAVAEAAAPLGASLLIAESPREEDILALIDADTASS